LVRAEGKENEQHCFVADSSTPVQLICCIPANDRCRL